MTDMSPDQSEVPMQNRIRQSFRRGLDSYHAHATVQATIANDLAAMLQQAGAPDRFGRALEFGCGTGHLTDALLDRFHVDDLTLNDLVQETCLALSGRISDRVRRLGHVSGAIETAPLPWGLDLIASASTVQWVADVPELMTRLADHLAPGGWLALSGFGQAQFHQLVSLGSKAAALSYIDQGDWQAVLPEHLELVALRQRPIHLCFDTAIDLLRHLRKTGVNGQSNQHWTRADLTRFEDSYRARFSRDGRLELTYDPVWMIARKRG